jgi:hypothetical protein
MTDDDLTGLVRQIVTEVRALREEQVRQANELNLIKTTVVRIELKLQQRVGV